MRPRVTKYCMLPYVVGLYRECLNYSPGVKFGPDPGVTTFRMANIEKNLEISLYLAVRPKLTKFCI